jgi:hypothetical protein
MRAVTGSSAEERPFPVRCGRCLDDPSSLERFDLTGKLSSGRPLVFWIRSGQPYLDFNTDNGSQYVTWRGQSAFSKELNKRGIRQVVAAPRRPQTLGKIERFWDTLWRECVESAVFVDRGDAQRRIGLFIDHYKT